MTSKLFFFIALSPIAVVIMLFLYFTYGDAQGKGGWQGMWDKSWPWKILAVVLSVVFVPAIAVARHLLPKWEKLAD